MANPPAQTREEFIVSLKPDTAYMEVPRCDSCRFWREMQAGLPIVGQAPLRRCVRSTTEMSRQVQL